MAPNTNVDPRKQLTRRVWYWAATIAAMALYVPIASELLKATKKVTPLFFMVDPLYALLLGPPLCALCAALTLVFIGHAKTASPNAQMFWALLLIGAVFGWPVSCGTGALLTAGSSGWIAH